MSCGAAGWLTASDIVAVAFAGPASVAGVSAAARRSRTVLDTRGSSSCFSSRVDNRRSIASTCRFMSSWMRLTPVRAVRVAVDGSAAAGPAELDDDSELDGLDEAELDADELDGDFEESPSPVSADAAPAPTRMTTP